MLKSFRFKNFKSFKEAELPLAPLTVLIGANASGKSNAIEGIELLSWLAKGRQLEDIYAAIRDEDLAIRGSLPSLVYNDKDKFLLQTSFHVKKHDPLPALDCTLSIELGVTENGLKIEHEQMEIDGFSRQGYQTIGQNKTTDELLVKVGGSSKTSYQVRASPTQAVFTQGLHGKKTIFFNIIRGRGTAESGLRNVFFLNPNPSKMRSYSFKSDRQLRGDGTNLSASLYHLHMDLELTIPLLDFVQSLPEQDIKGIGFIETPRSEVMVQLVENFGRESHAVDAGSLSDGTLRVLAIAAALLSVPEGTLVVIEEIDNGVHPSRANELLAQIQKVIKERNLQVLVTTHNPALLDALPPEVVHDTVACYRDPEDGSSKLVRLRDLEDYAQVVASGPLGHVVTDGILERILKDTRTPEEKVQENLAWLEDLKASIAER